MYVEKVAYIPFAIQVRLLSYSTFAKFPVAPLIIGNDAQPVLKSATGSNGEPLTRRSLGIDKNAYAHAYPGARHN